MPGCESIDSFEDLFVLRAGDAAGFRRSPGHDIGKCSVNVSAFRRESGEVESCKSFVFMEPARGLEPRTY